MGPFNMTMNRSRLRQSSALLVLAMALAAAVRAGDVAGTETRITRRSEAVYSVPAVSVVRDDGKRVSLAAELDDGRPVALNFIYTSCTTICPLSSQIFAQFQDRLGEKRANVHLVSISIDPEQDTPARLRDYGRQFGAKPGWDHYTGAFNVISDVQRAFHAYRGDKMSHTPLTFLREAPGKPWVRIDGFATVDELLAESRGWAVPALVSR